MSSKNGLCLAFGDRMTRSVSIAFFSVVQRGKKYCHSHRDGEGYWKDEEKEGLWGKVCWGTLGFVGAVQERFLEATLPSSASSWNLYVKGAVQLFPLGALGSSPYLHLPP